jgi:hypothetical protein
MNSQQLYATANLVHRNLQNVIVSPQSQLHLQEQLQQVPVSDVFEIPEFDLPVISNTKVQVQAQALPVQSQSAASAAANAANFVNTINHNAMTYVMKQLANQKQKTPSISTKQSDLSIQPPKPVSPPAQQPSQARSPTAIASNSTGAGVGETQALGTTTSTKKIIPKSNSNTLNKKVIVEEEDKESAIDYDDDDVDIKKTKLSLFQFAKDITFNLIFAIPFLQKARLNAMLKDPTLAINQIESVFDEFKDQLSQFELESIKKYVCEDGIRDQLNFILESGFNKILSDGVIDINDAPQFNQLVYYIIKSFNEINNGKVYRFYISREHVMLLLHFVLKSVFTLTLKGQEEQMALGLLDTSFKLVQLEVLPIVSKRWYHRFRICKTAKQIEDIIE